MSSRTITLYPYRTQSRSIMSSSTITLYPYRTQSRSILSSRTITLYPYRTQSRSIMSSRTRTLQPYRTQSRSIMSSRTITLQPYRTYSNLIVTFPGLIFFPDSIIFLQLYALPGLPPVVIKQNRSLCLPEIVLGINYIIINYILTSKDFVNHYF